MKPQPQVLPEEVDELSCRLLDAVSIVNPATTGICICGLHYCIPWEGQDFTKTIVPLLLEETDAMSVVGGLFFLFFSSLLLSMTLVSIRSTV